MTMHFASHLKKKYKVKNKKQKQNLRWTPKFKCTFNHLDDHQCRYLTDCSDAILFPLRQCSKYSIRSDDIHFIKTLSRFYHSIFVLFLSLRLKASDDKREIIRKSNIFTHKRNKNKMSFCFWEKFRMHSFDGTFTLWIFFSFLATFCEYTFYIIW